MSLAEKIYDSPFGIVLIALLVSSLVAFVAIRGSQLADQADTSRCLARPHYKRVMILKGDFAHQKGDAKKPAYDGGCYVEVKLDQSKAIIKVRVDNLAPVEEK